MPITLTCSRGHSWQVADADASPDAAANCPLCAGMLDGASAPANLPTATAHVNLPAEPVNPSAPLSAGQGTVSHHHSHDSSAVDGKSTFQVPGFELLGELGQGGMGVVWRACDLALDREVALKLLHERYPTDSMMAQRFVEEALITAQLQHPGIPAVYQVGKTAAGRPYLAMKLIKGRTLHDLLMDRTPSESNWLGTFEAICQAVGYAHAHGVIHRDLKPTNVMVGNFGQVQVMDWGLAKVLRGSAASRQLQEPAGPPATNIRSPRALDGSETQAGAFIGTPAFMPPEQAAGEIGRIDQRSDVFALGAILSVILTGKPPYSGGDAEAVRIAAMRGKLDDALARLDALGGEPELVALAKRCLAFEPEERPADANAVAAEVARLRSNAEQRAREAELQRARAQVQAAEQRKRRRQQVVLSAVIGLLLAGGSTGIYLKYREARDQEALVGLKAGELELALGRESERVAERDAALVRERQRLQERDQALGTRDVALAAAAAQNRQLIYQLGIGDFLVARAAYADRDVVRAQERLRQVPEGQRGFEWNYLARQCQGGIFTLYGHSHAVMSAEFSPDGRHLVTGSWDQTARVWDARSGSPIRVLKGHTGYVMCASYSPDSATIVTGSFDNTAKVWDAHSGKQLLDLKGHAGWVNSASYSPDGGCIVTGSDDKTARLWDARSGVLLREFRGHFSGVGGVAFGPDGRRVVTAGKDGGAQVWDVDGDIPRLSLVGHKATVRCVAYSPDGSRIVTGSQDATAKVWDAADGTQLLDLKGHTSGVNSVAFSPDGLRIVTGSWDHTAKIWDAHSGTALLELKGHTGLVMGVAFSPDGQRVITSSVDRTAKTWDAGTGAPLRVLQGHPAAVSSASFSADGQCIVISSLDRTATVWAARSGMPITILRGRLGEMTGAAFSPDGRRIVTAHTDNTAVVWDARGGKQLFPLNGHAGGVASAAYSPDGQSIVTGSWDKTAKVWDAQSGSLLLTLKGHSGFVEHLSYSADGLRIATASLDRTAKVWDAHAGTMLFDLKGHLEPVGGVAFSFDNRRIVTASSDTTAKVWDARSGELQLDLRGHTGGVTSAAFSPDGERIVTGSGDRTAKIWEARTGMPLLDLRGHTDAVVSVAFSPDGQSIVTGSTDKTARVWDAHSGLALVNEATPAGGRINEYTPDGKYFVHYDGDRVRLVPAAPPFDDLEYRLLWTGPRARNHREEYVRAKEGTNAFAAAFHLDRLLACLPGERPHWLAERAGRQKEDLISNARTAAHSPGVALQAREPIVFLAAQGSRLARRCLGGLLVRQGKPAEAVAVLTAALEGREADRPPVEELLLSLALAEMRQMPQSRAWLDKATSWIDRYKQPLQIASALGRATAGPLTGVTELYNQPLDPRFNAFDWETWYELDVFRQEAQAKLGLRH